LNYDLTVIGNCCTDFTAPVSEDFLRQNSLILGQNVEFDEQIAFLQLKSKVLDYAITPGGAGANTAHVVSALGGKTAFMGVRADDPEGALFEKSLRDAIIDPFVYKLPSSTLPSPQVLCFITPGGERSFASFNGVATTLTPNVLDLDVIAASTITLLDGHALCSATSFETLMHAALTARAAEQIVAINIADTGLIDRYGDEIEDLLIHSDCLIMNRSEGEHLTGLKSLEKMASFLSQKFPFGAITDGSAGSIVFDCGRIVNVPPADLSGIPADKIDSNGAGDHYAGGFLFGLAHHLSIEECGLIATLCARDCLSHSGARPMGPLSYLLPEDVLSDLGAGESLPPS